MRFKDLTVLLNVLSVFFILFLFSCAESNIKKDVTPLPKNPNEELNTIAESYVRLMLGMDTHERGYVDAYYGEPAIKEEVELSGVTLAELKSEAEELLQSVNEIDMTGEEEILLLRRQYLAKQLESVRARIDMVEGIKFSFDEEAKFIFDATPPTLPDSFFEKIIEELDDLLPGEGSVSERLNKFKADFIVPDEKVDVVFEEAIREARERTKKHIRLPENEKFELEYVRGKSWTGYNWYKGNNHSLIQLNRDIPLSIDRVIDVASHEGYPGHHVYNVLLENKLAKGRGWVEFTVNPLYSSQSMISEGSANFGIEVAFPGEERIKYEREILFPLAGLDSTRVEEYYKVFELTERLDYVDNEVARGYLNGILDRKQAEEKLVRLRLLTPERAAQRVRFIDQYRAYVINYNLGKDLVREYIESRGGTSDNPEKRWAEFEALLSSPRLPSSLN